MINAACLIMPSLRLQPASFVISCSMNEQVAKLTHLTRLVGHKSELTSFFKAKPTAGNT
jgi:hypothetical protein